MNIPWFVDAILLFPGPVLIGLALPLYRRRVPPNGLYGVRFPATFADPEVWYATNARGGRDLIAVTLAYLALTIAVIVSGNSLAHPIRLLGPLAFLVVALIGDAIILALAARRLLAKRRRAPSLSATTSER